MKQSIQLSDHFNFKKLFSFTLGPICTMIFTSLYSIVDGYYVSNYVGSTALAALNLVMPVLMILAAVGFMFGSGGCALVSMYMGMNQYKKANESFSLIVYTLVIVGFLTSLIGYIFAYDLCLFLGATKELMPYCLIYLKINLIGNTFFMLQNLFQTFLIAAEKPKLGLYITILAGVTNMILDFLLVGYFCLGIGGAAIATVLGQVVGGGIPFIYFVLPNKSKLHLGKTHFELYVLSKTCFNGVSEFLSNISASIVGFLYNLQLLKYIGENGVAAYGVIMYVSFVFVAIYIGYSMGVAPIIGFNYGANNREELHNVVKKSMIIMASANVLMTLLAEGFSSTLVHIFAGYDASLYNLTLLAMRMYSLAFLMTGFNIFSSSLFTALGNGKISAILSTTRSLILQITMIYILPCIFGINGLWLVAVFVDFFGFIVSLYFVLRYKSQYGY